MRKKVLLVDDTKTVLMSERLMLSGQGFDISTASNGKEALVEIARSRPDLILLDIQMPEMDGIELCRRVKADRRTASIPIIMVTTRGEAEKIEEAFGAGCNDYVTKPIVKLELLAKIKSHIA